METPTIFAFLLVTAISTFAVQSMGVYLRSFKEEPFLIQSIVVVSLTAIGVIVAAPRWGSLGVAVSYFVSSGIVGVGTAVVIFRAKRQHRRNLQGLRISAAEGLSAIGGRSDLMTCRIRSKQTHFCLMRSLPLRTSGFWYLRESEEMFARAPWS